MKAVTIEDDVVEFETARPESGSSPSIVVHAIWSVEVVP
jgi:hypothetical protein